MFDIVSEPTDVTYSNLLACAAESCSTFSLTWCDDHTFESSAREVEQLLTPFLLRAQRTDRWPGTILTSSEATVRYYRLTAESLSILERPRALYAWLAPALPEDLAFYTAVGGVWLGSIGHERDAWLEVPPELATEVMRRIPGLQVEQRNE